MQRLKESTQALHDSAEGHKLQSGLARGELDVGMYAAYLEQLYLIHRELEHRLRESRASNSVFSRAIADAQMQEEFLATDLRVLGRDPNLVKPVPATQKLVDKISEYAAGQPLSLLGLHYVLLGSKHGGKYIARQLAKTYNLNEGEGNKYFDPYGSEFMPLWMQFKNAINESQLSEQDCNAIIEGAQQMYASIANISEELLN
jgi:heme oxygenase